MPQQTSSIGTIKFLFQAGVQSVLGEKAVAKACQSQPIEVPTAILCIGKAAYSMYCGLSESIRQDVPALIITKEGHSPGTGSLPSHIRIIESTHPTPSGTSLIAGQTALDLVKGCGSSDRLLMLVSGGASSLAEVLSDGNTYDDLLRLTETSLSDGSNISTINARRKAISSIKAGRLLSCFKGCHVQVFAISDVAGDDISIIGSGIGEYQSGDFDYSCRIVASNSVARDAVASAAQAQGLRVIANDENLYGDVEVIAEKIYAKCLSGTNGIYIFGGEPTIKLPPNPGKGGRNQSLALLLAKYFQGQPNIFCLVAGTDGTDGVTEAAGAIIDGHSYTRLPGADQYLAAADAGTYFKTTGDQLITGPTGTNVMDLVIVLKYAS
ncbi:MAG: MOFRL family protein [Sneathiella sp.]|nr:MAG: MOFRL family protein [Sneathiella sp.]